MARWDNEELSLTPNVYPNAPCHTCIYRDRVDFGDVKGGAKFSCTKYPLPRYSIGIKGKPAEVLDGIAPCEYYQKESL